jgi:C-terminal processing protease CtpA/Prc
VIDLRFNTGGDVTALHKLLGYFFPTGTKIGSTKSTTSSTDEIIGTGANIEDREIYIWTWYLTDSASQIFTGVMSENSKATTIGVDLDGNVETISCTSTYPDNARLCNSKDVFTPVSGNNWNKDGIPVDYEIGELIWGKFYYENDPYKSKTESLIN